jgi:hypothetical protein
MAVRILMQLAHTALSAAFFFTSNSCPQRRHRTN